MSAPVTPSKSGNTAAAGPPREASTTPVNNQSVNQSPRDRIDNILESARARKVTMDEINDSAPPSPRAQLLRDSSRRTADTESSADEETSIVHMRLHNNMNYQSTQSRPSRPQSTYSSTRRSVRTYDQGRQHSNNEEDIAAEHQSWWARMISEFGSIELENKGSVARDHLALERTFLAWLRTSLAFASIGIAITQLFRLNVTTEKTGETDSYRRLRQVGKPLGATFLGISIVMLVVGFRRYFGGQYWIIRGKFPASRGSIALVAAITCALVVASLIVVIVVEPGAYEN